MGFCSPSPVPKGGDKSLWPFTGEKGQRGSPIAHSEVLSLISRTTSFRMVFNMDPWQLSAQNTERLARHSFLVKTSLTLETFSWIPPTCCCFILKEHMCHLYIFLLQIVCLYFLLIFFYWSISSYWLFNVCSHLYTLSLFHCCCLFLQDSHSCSSGIIPSSKHT